MREIFPSDPAVPKKPLDDALFQMELVRKSATGNVAELFGRDFLSGDADARRQFYSDEELQYLVSTVSCPIQTLVQGFVDGVNAYVDAIYADASLANVPHEFFFVPTGIRLQGNGTIPSGVRYTVESFGSTEVYKPDKWRTGVVISPHGVAFNDHGDLFVSEYSLFGRVHRFNRE